MKSVPWKRLLCSKGNLGDYFKRVEIYHYLEPIPPLPLLRKPGPAAGAMGSGGERVPQRPALPETAPWLLGAVTG